MANTLIRWMDEPPSLDNIDPVSARWISNTFRRNEMLYEVEFSYTEPMFGSIELNADEETVKQEALQHIRMSYPEAEDIEITAVKVVE